MLNSKMLQALNDQINAEFYSAYLYLSMSAWFENEGLSGFANWMKIQFQEEQSHALKIFDYVNERGGRVVLKPFDEVPVDFKGIVEAFEHTLEHEQMVTGLINNLADIAIEVSDHATQSFLKWFIDEQVEEEANVTEILDTLRLIDGQGNGLFMLDREMKQRVFVDETKAI